MGTGADGRAVDGGHGRLVELPQLPDEGLDADAQRLAGRPGVEPVTAGATHGRLAQVHARAERVTHAGDEQGPHRVVGSGLAHAGDDVVAHLDAQGVLGLGSIQGEAGDVIVADLVADHGLSVPTAVRRSRGRCSVLTGGVVLDTATVATVCAGVRRSGNAVSSPVVSLEEAVARHVPAGDAVHVVTGHTRWTAAARELIRQWWGRDPRLHPRHAQPFEPRRRVLPGRAVSKVVTGYSGDVFPNFTPNQVVRGRLPVG